MSESNADRPSASESGGDWVRGRSPRAEMSSASRPSEIELRQRLTPMQFEVTQHAATERAFTGEYWNEHADGTYHCIVCDAALFSSATKYDSGCGWPSFFQSLTPESVTYIEDRTHGMLRVEATCTGCGAHLGHLFPDGPAPTGERFCMNSASLRLDRDTAE